LYKRPVLRPHDGIFKAAPRQIGLAGEKKRYFHRRQAVARRFSFQSQWKVMGRNVSTPVYPPIGINCNKLKGGQDCEFREGFLPVFKNPGKELLKRLGG